jgi:hypothetical protein
VLAESNVCGSAVRRYARQERYAVDAQAESSILRSLETLGHALIRPTQSR